MRTRVERLFENIEADCAVLISGGANVFYYSGFTSEDAYLLITRSDRYIITDSRYFIQARLEASDFEIADISKGWKYVFNDISENTVCFEENNITFAEYEKISACAEKKRFIPKQKEIDAPRRIKDKKEIELIAAAEHLGDMAFSHILEVLNTGMSEREIALELEMYMRGMGADGLSFETIAASGVRSAMPHGTASDKTTEKGDLLTLDFGCVYKGYCSDMTRTVVFGNPTAEQSEIYSLVLAAQTAALDFIRPGVSCAEADNAARRVIQEGGHGAEFTHSLGHSVGTEIHENPVFSPKSKDILCEGNVMSVEPGIYIDGWGGVRIEDLTAVIDGKIVNLTKSPKELIVI